MSTANTPQRATVVPNAGKSSSSTPQVGIAPVSGAGSSTGASGSGAPSSSASTPTTTTKKPRENRDPLAPFHQKIHELILKPKLDELVKEHPGKSDSELHEQFRKDTGSCVALRRFREWMADWIA